ncbi:MAG: hypothetical protein KA163_12290 [Bacteroidia bacterium]|nr:hypothetical protein [Bacteroidia bacterium]
MEKNKIIATVRQQFIENADEGLLFNLNPNDFNKVFKLSPSQESVLNDMSQRYSWQQHELPDKTDILYYLSMVLIQRTFMRERIRYDRDDFYEKFWAYWTDRFNNVKTLIEKTPDHFAAETIGEKDLVYINVTETPTVIIFIITSKNIIKLNINAQGKKSRTVQIISRDIKKIEAIDSSVVLRYHGQHQPETIEIDSDKSAIKLQDHLTDLRGNRK